VNSPFWYGFITFIFCGIMSVILYGFSCLLRYQRHGESARLSDIKPASEPGLNPSMASSAG
jgi:hypothetical protein